MIFCLSIVNIGLAQRALLRTLAFCLGLSLREESSAHFFILHASKKFRRVKFRRVKFIFKKTFPAGGFARSEVNFFQYAIAFLSRRISVVARVT